MHVVAKMFEGSSLRPFTMMWFVTACLCAAFPVRSQAVNLWQGSADGDWFEPGNWSAGVPADETAVTVGTGSSIVLTNATASMAVFDLAAGATLTFQGWNSSLNADEMTINGTLTHWDHFHVTETNAVGEWVTDHRIYLKGSNITIAAGAMLDGNGKGYPRNAGPGRGIGNSDGAGHAGLGAPGTMNAAAAAWNTAIPKHRINRAAAAAQAPIAARAAA